jgi:hypothetical protein
MDVLSQYMESNCKMTSIYGNGRGLFVSIPSSQSFPVMDVTSMPSSPLTPLSDIVTEWPAEETTALMSVHPSPTSPVLDDPTSPALDDLTSPMLDDLTSPMLDDPTSPALDDLTSPMLDDPTSPAPLSPLLSALSSPLSSAPSSPSLSSTHSRDMQPLDASNLLMPVSPSLSNVPRTCDSTAISSSTSTSAPWTLRSSLKHDKRKRCDSNESSVVGSVDEQSDAIYEVESIQDHCQDYVSTCIFS